MELTTDEVKQAARTELGPDLQTLQNEMVKMRADMLHMGQQILTVFGEKHQENLRRFDQLSLNVGIIRRFVIFLTTRDDDGRPRYRTIVAVFGVGPLVWFWHLSAHFWQRCWIAIRGPLGTHHGH